MRKLGGTLRAPTLTGGFILKALGGEAILYGGCPLAWMADASVIGGRAMRASSLSGYVKGLSWLCSSGKLLGLVALVRPAVCLHSHHVRFTLCTRAAPFAASTASCGDSMRAAAHLNGAPLGHGCSFASHRRARSAKSRERRGRCGAFNG